MSKESEAFTKEKQALDELYDVAGNIKNLKDDYIILKTALQRLESIDNVKPSEAMEDLKELHELAYGNDETSWKIDEIRMSSHIKNALLKAQEMEKELKAIKESNPSEAIRMLDDISYLVLNEIDDLKNKELWKSYFITIKQALLKAQEQEKELEDAVIIPRATLEHWFELLCVNGCNSKGMVRNDIQEVLKNND